MARPPATVKVTGTCKRAGYSLPMFPSFFVHILVERFGLVPSRAHLLLVIGQTFPCISLYGRASVVVPLRPSSEHILIVRAPGAEGHTGFPNLFFPPSRGRPG